MKHVQTSSKSQGGVKEESNTQIPNKANMSNAKTNGQVPSGVMEAATSKSVIKSGTKELQGILST